jgi:hypothetical protein
MIPETKLFWELVTDDLGRPERRLMLQTPATTPTVAGVNTETMDLTFYFEQLMRRVLSERGL